MSDFFADTAAQMKELADLATRILIDIELERQAKIVQRIIDQDVLYERTTMRLWIFSDNPQEDRRHLESLGVGVGQSTPASKDYTPGSVNFHCTADDKALKALQPFWMDRYIWGPEPGEELPDVNVGRKRGKRDMGTPKT